jgi:NAD(P)-dependent dehydrogenase (short-subunit alcohol dehydrogenase family)
VVTAPTQRVALVTGANRGIGFEIARQIAEAGMTVLVGARDASRGRSAVARLADRNLAAAFVELDVTSASSVAAAAVAIEEQYGRLDVLVNNAAVADPGDGPPDVTTLDTVRRTFDTNFFGALAVTQAMLPLLRRSRAGRIINMASGLGSLALNGDKRSPFYQVRLLGYNASKAALNMLTIQLAANLDGEAVTVVSVCPGLTNTELSGHRGDQTPAQGAVLPAQFALMVDGQASGTFVNADGQLPW